VANGYGVNYVPGFQYLSYGDSAYDARQQLVGLYNYEIPVPHSITGNAFARSALTGWHFSGISALQNGSPVTIYDAGVYNSPYCDQFSFVNCPDVPNTSTFHIKTLNPRHRQLLVQSGGVLPGTDRDLRKCEAELLPWTGIQLLEF
jgi:hypothetical protein